MRSSTIRRLAALAVALCGAGLAANAPASAGIRLAQKGQTSYVIVQGREPSEAERFAAQELADHLKRVTGAEFPLAAEGDSLAGMRAIYLGWTAFAAARGIDLAKLDGEEWVLRTVGQDLILAGGRPRGTLYAVYEFLEAQVGCRWLSRDAEVIPSRPDLEIPTLDVRGKPAFWMRGIYTHFAAWKADGAAETLFRIRNKQNGEDASIWQARFGGGEYAGSPRGCHTFFAYVDPKVYAAEHPDYFSDDGKGSRSWGHGAQLCLTHPEVRRIVLERLKELIEKDRQAYAKRGLPAPRIYDISQEDDSSHGCRCPSCRALIEREGSESGPVVEFINAIADGIRGSYPEIRLQTFAYVYSEQPPKTLRPRDNVLIRYCDLYSKSDPFRPLTHPVNREQAELPRAWGKVAPHLVVWDYWKMGRPQWNEACPDAIAPVLKADFEFLLSNRVEGFFIETEESETDQSFFALSCWLGLKLLQNPRQPAEPLIDSFMHGYYGPAAPPMTQYYHYLAQRVAAEPQSLVKVHPYTRTYLDVGFFQKSKGYLKAAADACAPGSPELLRVWREQTVVDNCLLNTWTRLEGANGGKLPFDRRAVIEEYGKIRLAVIEAWRSRALRPSLKKGLEEELALHRNAPELPEEFRNLPPGSVVSFTSPKFTPYHSEIVPDGDAAGGYALRLQDTGAEAHAKPPVFGVYDFTRKEAGPSLVVKDVPQDGKYHLYKVGRFRVTPGVRLWGHASWVLGCDLSPAFTPQDGVENANVWDIYVSARFTGPAYIPGSAPPNGYFMDRVLLVKPQ